MHGHFEESPVSVGPAITDLIGADPVADPDAGSESAGGSGLPRRIPPVTRSHGGAFSHQEVVDFDEWSASAGIG